METHVSGLVTIRIILLNPHPPRNILQEYSAKDEKFIVSPTGQGSNESFCPFTELTNSIVLKQSVGLAVVVIKIVMKSKLMIIRKQTDFFFPPKLFRDNLRHLDV